VSNTKGQFEEYRYYVVVPKYVEPQHYDPGATENKVPMVPGRLIAQGHHVGRLMEFKDHSREYVPTTTIVLAVQNSREFDKIALAMEKLADELGAPSAVFLDTNAPLYGTTHEIPTIASIGSVTASEVADILGHLDLYA